MRDYEVLESFRSINILWSSKSAPCNTSIGDFFGWIKKYDTWYKNQLKISSDQNLHYLYSRSLSLTILECSRNHLLEFCGLIDLCTELGYSFILNIGIIESRDHYEIINQYIEKKGFQININWDQQDGNGVEVIAYSQDLVERILSASISLIISGEYSYWKQAGIFRNQRANKALYRFLPNACQTIQPQKVILPDPCRSRFGVLIDSEGRLFPCLGLFGIDVYSLGTIYMPIDQILLNECSRKELFSEWMRIGPKLLSDDNVNTSAEHRIPLICSLHRHINTYKQSG